MTVVQDAEATGAGRRQRELWVDNLRVLVIAGVIIVHTATGYVVDIAGWCYDDERTGTFAQYLRTTEVSVMWFAAALLVFSLVYAVWELRRPTPPSPQPLRLRVCIVAVVSIGLTSFALWQMRPLHEDVYLNPGEWPGRRHRDGGTRGRARSRRRPR
jgi:hypothetical protein